MSNREVGGGVAVIRRLKRRVRTVMALFSDAGTVGVKVYEEMVARFGGGLEAVDVCRALFCTLHDARSGTADFLLASMMKERERLAPSLSEDQLVAMFMLSESQIRERDARETLAFLSGMPHFDVSRYRTWDPTAAMDLDMTLFAVMAPKYLAYEAGMHRGNPTLVSRIVTRSVREFGEVAIGSGWYTAYEEGIEEIVVDGRALKPLQMLERYGMPEILPTYRWTAALWNRMHWSHYAHARCVMARQGNYVRMDGRMWLFLLCAARVKLSVAPELLCELLEHVVVGDM